MAPISKQLINEVLSIYKPKFKWLKTAHLEYPSLIGRFSISPGTYTHKPFIHMTDIEAQLCLNQLAYVGLAEAIRTKIIPKLRGINFKELQYEGMLIIETRKRFRKKIPTNKIIKGEIKVKEWRDDGYILRGFADFQFENRSCFGNLEMALVK